MKNKLFKKKEIFKVKSVPVDPVSMEQPASAAEYQRRGMAYYARKQFDAAEADLKKAISLDGNHIDSFYSLGMVFKAQDRKDEAVEAFKQVLALLAASSDAGKANNDMLRRLALGHINEITQGDWNLEKEIWKHIA
jgi:tetratricopeptide (TPR) repeat protein